MGKLVNGIIAAIATLFIMAGISMPTLAATDDTYVPKNDSAGNIFVQDQANVLSAIRRRHIHWQRSNRQLVTRKSGISNLVEKKTQDMETRIIEVKVRLIGQRNQHELHWRFS